MTVKEAVIEILNTEGKSLNINDLTNLILSRGLWQPAGKTPAATVEAQLATDIKHKGENSPFVRVAPRTYGLRKLGAKPAPEAPKNKKGQKTLSFTNAAEKILAQYGDKKPMHYRMITEKIICRPSRKSV